MELVDMIGVRLSMIWRFSVLERSKAQNNF